MGSYVPVRDAVPEDAYELVAVWRILMAQSKIFARSSPPPTTHALRLKIEEITSHPHRRIIVAVADGAIAGVACLSSGSLTPMNPSNAVRISYLWVFDRFRRRGVGHALVEEAVAWATELSVDQLLVDLEPGDRDSHRFFARLGVTPLIVQRSAPLSAIRRRLAAQREDEDEWAAPLGKVRHLSHAIRSPWSRTISASK